MGCGEKKNYFLGIPDRDVRVHDSPLSQIKKMKFNEDQ